MYIYIYIVRDGWLRLVASHLLRVGGLCVFNYLLSVAIRLKQFAFKKKYINYSRYILVCWDLGQP